LLRPALELAWAVAKVGGQARPAIPVPGRLRPLMGFARLPDRALSTVRQVVDEDDDFRLRVAQVADETALGRPSWLWLVRPEGWEADLDALGDAADVADAEVREEKEERRARKRLDAAEAALARGEAERVRLRQVNAKLVEEVAAERRARRRAEVEREGIEASLTSDVSELAQLQATIADLESRNSALVQQARASADHLAATGRERDAAGAEIERLGTELQSASAAAARLTADREQTRAAVGTFVLRASAAAQELGDILAELAEAVSAEQPGATTAGAGVPRPNPPIGLRTGRGRTAELRVPPIRRSPVALPPALFDDSIEAARFLVRVQEILLVVDGYNVTLSSWPDLELPRQRHRLVDALAELVMRAGTSVHVVFDGADVAGRFGPPAAVRRKMRVTFSPETVEADEVIIDLVGSVDPSQPVVVATDDRRVRDEVGRRGANVISVTQLLAVLGRAPGSAAG
jgi:predicted RNA-binding protein with PIN domain